MNKFPYINACNVFGNHQFCYGKFNSAALLLASWFGFNIKMKRKKKLLFGVVWVKGGMYAKLCSPIQSRAAPITCRTNKYGRADEILCILYVSQELGTITIYGQAIKLVLFTLVLYSI